MMLQDGRGELTLKKEGLEKGGEAALRGCQMKSLWKRL